MAEYIEREALREIVTNQGYANIDDILNIEAADVAPVVRCKECKQWQRNTGFVDSPNGHCFYHDIEMNGHDFCSYGEGKNT